MLYLDGVYGEDNYGKTRFDDEHPCSPPYGQPGQEKKKRKKRGQVACFTILLINPLTSYLLSRIRRLGECKKRVKIQKYH
jgi:hypothetical protein